MNIYGKKLISKIDRITIMDKKREIDVLMITGYNKNNNIKKIIFAYAEDDIFFIPKNLQECFIIKKTYGWDFKYKDKHGFDITFERIDRHSNYIINNMLIHLYKQLGKRAYIRLLNISGKVILNSKK